MTPEQLEEMKQLLKSVQPADGQWTPGKVQTDIYKAINTINRELRKIKEKDMGIGIGKKCSSSPYAVESSNPDPKNFIIESEKEYKGYLMLLVKYPNCTNFEGRKLLVYQGVKSSAELLEINNNELDPHFSSTNKKGSPIARFRPNQNSINLIKAMINAITIQKAEKKQDISKAG